MRLDPLTEASMRELLAGIAPGLPEPAVARILARADGIPLYAVETIRMFLADGRISIEDDGRVRLRGELDEIDVPPTLQALVAARLDSLPPADRAILQDASVLGQSFTVPALAAVSGDDPAALATRLAGLVRRELLVVETDPRAPTRGQHAFIQSLIREVAYATLSKRDRRTRHLAAARYFESLDDDELAGALATHYVAAYRAAPEGPEGEAAAAQARIALRASRRPGGGARRPGPGGGRAAGGDRGDPRPGRAPGPARSDRRARGALRPVRGGRAGPPRGPGAGARQPRRSGRRAPRDREPRA